MRAVKLAENREILVAGEGFEPPTKGCMAFDMAGRFAIPHRVSPMVPRGGLIHPRQINGLAGFPARNGGKQSQ